ncbi:MAG: hypothetical protein H6698_09260 [Myxococcales bacterium]|nr:hypothetical protein [Myxococcales bacterium]MCB9521581.1 hypothetical protein [Myxococcales bacterium]MCB9530577.1 hypothetical protein [Myxococcales bacterium]MCB9534474.1 hypothetical protein [Myxococcales bacterium]
MRLRSMLRATLALTALLLAAPALAGNGSALLGHVPGTAQVVVGVNVEALRSTSLWSTALDLADDDTGVNNTLNTLTTAGFDPRTQVRSLVIASSSVGPTSGDHAVILIEASYPRDAVAQVLIDDGYTAGTEGEIAFYQKGQSTVAFLSDTVVAVGEHALVAPAMSGSAGASGRVASQLRAVDKSGTIWIATTIPESPQGAQAARASIDLSSGLRVNLTLAMESADAATTAASDFNTQIAGVAAAPEVQALGVGPLVSGLQAAASGTDVTLSTSVAAGDLDNLVTRLVAIAREEMR